MTVYVDNVFIPAKVGRLDAEWCHMFTDSADPTELHELAQKIGLKRAWFQSKPGQRWGDHYDVTTSKRRLAIKHGAVEIDWHKAAEIWAQKRKA
jgi:Protein of unknown function (DUF4031)